VDRESRFSRSSKTSASPVCQTRRIIMPRITRDAELPAKPILKFLEIACFYLVSRAGLESSLEANGLSRCRQFEK
jgi:hypothetical protein